MISLEGGQDQKDLCSSARKTSTEQTERTEGVSGKQNKNKKQKKQVSGKKQKTKTKTNKKKNRSQEKRNTSRKTKRIEPTEIPNIRKRNKLSYCQLSSQDRVLGINSGDVKARTY